MLRSLCRILTLLSGLLSAASLAAQQTSPFDSIQTPHGTCRVWIGIPGGSGPEDRSYAPCAVDRPAELVSEAALPQPWISTSIHGDFTVVVNEDGSVDPRLTRAWSIGMDSVAYRRTLEGLRQWRFQPAVRQGVAVRSGFMLQVRTDQRQDTVPSELRWTYKHFQFGEDSLIGRWTTLPTRPAALTADQRDSLYIAVFRRLVHMRVLAPWLDQPYCVVAGEEGSMPDVHARLSRFLVQAFREHSGTDPSGHYRGIDGEPTGAVLGRGCEREPGALRFFVSGPHPTEGNRVVLSLAGDHLADWPPGYRGATFPGWTSRCVVQVPPGATARVHCDIRPRYSYRHGPRPWERTPPPQWYQPGDSIRVTVVARMRDAFQTDTMRAVVHDLRRFARSAVLDVSSDCSSRWGAFTTQDSGALYVVSGDLEGRGSLRITGVPHRAPPQVTQNGGCTGAHRDSTFAVFFLGDLGDPVREPVSFCTGRPLCTRRYLVDPARHTMAKRAAIRFRIHDLREMTRVGDQLEFRIYVEPVPEGLMPLIIVTSAVRPPLSVWPARRVELDAWDFAVTYESAIPSDSEILIYLVAR